MKSNFRSRPRHADAVEAALLEIGASSITFVDRGDEPVLEPKPGEIRLWRDTLVRALFEESATRRACNFAARSARRGLGSQVAADRTRARGRRPGLGTRLAHRLEIDALRAAAVGMPDAPPKRPPIRDAVVVRLDPGLAFGTGTHPTTALCLQILDSLPLAGRTVIDYGCGSGILGIAALKLGAAHVVAVDLDPQALLATRDNAHPQRRAREHRRAGHRGRACRAAYCVLANILAGPLIELAPKLTAACEPGGRSAAVGPAENARPTR